MLTFLLVLVFVSTDGVEHEFILDHGLTYSDCIEAGELANKEHKPNGWFCEADRGYKL